MPTTTNHSFDLPTVGSDRNTWGTSLNANWTSLDGKLVDRSGWVDTVSETSGVPTGGIIERGSDANGEYVRYADGTQECWINLFTTASSAAATWTFPAAFLDNTKVSVQATNAETTLRHFSVTTITQTTANIRSWDNSGSEAVTPQCRLHAIGRWFNP